MLPSCTTPTASTDISSQKMTTVPTKDPGSVFQTTILEPLAKSWWLMLLRGIVAIVFGVLAFVWPGVTLFTLVLFYGAYALVDGAFAIGEAVVGPGTAGPRWWMEVVGVLGVAAGLLTFLWPGITAIVLLYFIAGWAMATGVFAVIGAVRVREEMANV